MDETPIPKCSRTRWCPAMMESLQHANAHAKGLSPALFWLETPKPHTAIIGVIYKTKANDAGKMLNVCPWCAADLRWWPRSIDPLKKEQG